MAKQLYTELKPRSWEELKEMYFAFGIDWVFRGQREATWDINSSIERIMNAKALGMQDDKASKEEIGNILETEIEEPFFREFGTRLNQYVGAEAGTDSILGQFALMQHHGVPTRLVDWTESPYVATFFAVEDAIDQTGECAVWAIVSEWCQIKSAAAVRKKKKLSEEKFPDNVDFALDENLEDVIFYLNLPVVTPLRPEKLNARIAAQQGLFLCPGDLTLTFMENLKALGESELPNVFYKITFPKEWRTNILYDLRRMNIGPETLFPGLDGFARKIKLDMSLMSSFAEVDNAVSESAKKFGIPFPPQ